MMNKFAQLAILSPLLLTASAAAQAMPNRMTPQLKSRISATMASNAQVFTENKGQWDKSVKFSGRSGNLSIRLTSNGPVLTLSERQAKGKVLSQVVSMDIPGIKGFEAKSATPTRINYLGGKDRSKWATDVREYHEVRSDLGHGLSLRYYFDQGRPRYDLIAEPGSNPSEFAFHMKGASGLQLGKNGVLKIGTKAGTIEEKGLFAYQVENGSRKPVACRMALKGNTVSFRTGSYDHSKTLVIDPLIFSTSTQDWFLSQSSLPNSIARDSQGNIWFYGTADGSPQSGIYPISWPIIEKLSPDGKTVEDITYPFNDGNGAFSTPNARINAITVDHNDDPVVVGIVESNGGPFTTTSNAYQQTGQNGNAYVTQFSSGGNNVLYSSFLGGTKTDFTSPTFLDQAFAVTIDSNNNAVVVGNTISTDFPVTANAFQKTRTPNCQDAFVSVLSLNSPQLIYSTYFGGAGDASANPAGGLTAADSVALNSLGNIVVGGFTASKTLPTTVSVVQNTNNGTDNAYVAVFNPVVGNLQASTYLGGSGVDIGNAVGVTSNDSIVITGSTTSPDFPYTSGAFNGGAPKQYAAGKYYGAGFVTKLSSDLTTFNWSALLGAGAPKGLALDAQGEPVVVGIANNNPTVGSVYPTTPNAYQTSYIGPVAAFVSKLSASGSNLLYSTYYAGNGGELGYAITLDSSGNAYIRGVSRSYDLPLTQGGSSGDAMLVGLPDGTFPYATGFLAIMNLAPNNLTLAVSPNLIGGATGTGTVALPSPAPAGGTTVDLRYNGGFKFRYLLEPVFNGPSTSVQIPAGSTAASFQIKTVAVPETKWATVTAQPESSGLGVTKEFPIYPATTSSLALSQSSTVGGSTDRITLTATTNGPLWWQNSTYNVQLIAKSGNPNVAFISSSPNEYAGETVFPFSIGTHPVTAPTNVTLAVANYFAYDNNTYGWKGVTLTVYPDPLASFTVPQTTVPPNYYENATVSLGTPLTSPVTVLLSSSNSSLVPVPSSVKVSSSTAFQIKVGNIAVGQKVTLSASYNGATKSITLTGSATPLPERLQASSPTILGGSSSAAYVYMSGKVPQQTMGSASSSNTSVLTVPANFTIVSGAQSGLVKISTVPVTANASVTISATVNGATVSTSVTVLTPVPTALSVPSGITGGSSTTAKVTINGPAPSQGLWITLKSSNSVVQVPVGVEVLSGQTTASFKVATSSVSASTTATISASHGGTTVQAQMTVNP